MANAVYPKAKQHFLDQNPALDWDTQNIKACLVRGYTYSAAHEFLSDVTGGGGGTIVATSGNMGTKTVTDGVVGCANFAFTAVGAGAACQAVIFYSDSGVAGTSPLIVFEDTATGLPVTPNGGDINIAIDPGANKLFKL